MYDMHKVMNAKKKKIQNITDTRLGKQTYKVYEQQPKI